MLLTSFASTKWIDFTVDKDLSVKLPTQPTVIARDTIEVDGFEQHLKIHSATDEFGFYRVSRGDLQHESDNYLTPQGRQEWYAVGPVVEGMQQAKFISREVFYVNGIDGVERVYELPATGSFGHTLKYVRTLLVLVGKVGYEFWFISKTGFSNPGLNKKKQFFNSIKLQN